MTKRVFKAVSLIMENSSTKVSSLTSNEISNGTTSTSTPTNSSTSSGGGNGGTSGNGSGNGLAASTTSTPTDYSSLNSNPLDSSHQYNESHGQHQISTTVTTNRQSTGNSSNYGQNLSTSNSNGNSSTTNSFKLKQQRNYQTNRFDPMGSQTAGGYQQRNAAAAAAAQIHNPWNNTNVLQGQNPSTAYPTNLTATNTFALPHHYSQPTVDMYNYYGTTTTATPYATHPTQQNAYGQYGQTLIPQESPKGGHVVYVYGIGQRATQEEIFALFQPFGRVLRVDIIIDFNTGLCKGYAFVAMEQYQEAQMAVQSLNAAPFHGRQLQVRFKT